MNNSFYAWLSSQPQTHAFLLRAYDALRIPKTANKLHVLLRFTDKHPLAPTRRLLKEAHRAWRNRPRGKVFLQHATPQYEEIAELKDVTINYTPEEVTPFDKYFELSGLKSSGEITFVVNFQPTEEQDKAWDAVYRRFRDAQRASVLGVPFSEANTWERVYRRWGFKHREKCPLCREPHNKGRNLNVLCDACFTKTLENIVGSPTGYEQD